MRPEDRVTAFIADYLREHTKVVAAGQRSPFDLWNPAVRQLDQAHFAGGGGMELAMAFEGESPHNAAERLVGVEARGANVFVETEAHEGVSKRWFEYELQRVGGDWLIVRLRTYLDAADAPFVKPAEREGFENPPVIPFRDLNPDDTNAGDGMFDAGRNVQFDGESSVIEVRPVGALKVTSGILVVGDLGYGPYMLSPLGRRVPRGEYLVDVSIAFGRNAALRVKLSESPVVKWHPADMMETCAFVVGVDAGNVAVLDATAVLGVKARDKERAFEIYAGAAERPQTCLLSLVGERDAVIGDSGGGDGRYPVYWGCDANGTPAVLLVDFVLFPR